MKRIFIALVSTCALAIASPTFAQFPFDLSDVVFIEGSTTGEFIQGFDVTAELDVSISGGSITLNSSKKNSWPRGSGQIGTTNLNCCNANAWGFVKVGETWYGGTWEFLRTGQTTKLLSAFRGPSHLRFAPLQNFSVQNGAIYGFMVAGITRNGLQFNNIQERSNIVLYKIGEGVVDASAIGVFPEGAAADQPVLTPIIDLVID